MKRLILNRRIGELQSTRLRARRISLLGAEAVESQEYAMLDQLYNGPPMKPPPRITAKMKQQERKRLAREALIAKEKADREARLQAMDEASRAAAEAEEEERIRQKEAERAARKLERAAQKRNKRIIGMVGSDGEEDAATTAADDQQQHKKRKVALSPAEQEASLRAQLDELTESLAKQNTEKVQLFEALKRVLNKEKKMKAKEKEKAEAAALASAPPPKPAPPTGSSSLLGPGGSAAVAHGGNPAKPRMGLSLSQQQAQGKKR